MRIKYSPALFFVFDLDDTLFSEIEFLKSAYRHIAKELNGDNHQELYEEMYNAYSSRQNVFGNLVERFKDRLPHADLEWLLKTYREHLPEIKLSEASAEFIKKVTHHKIPAGLITDGRSVTQRNKLKALGIESLFSDIIISEEFGSEKPDPRNYEHFSVKYPDSDFYFFGDNTRKDFIVPIRLGWQTICIRDNGDNIHKQDFSQLSATTTIIDSFDEIQID